MITYTPNIIAFSHSHTVTTITLKHPDFSYFSYNNITLVALQKVDQQLQATACTTLPIDSFVSITKISPHETILKATTNASISNLLAQCIHTKETIPALLVTFGDPDAPEVAAKEQVYIPIFDESQHVTLNDNTRAGVLGASSASVTLSPLSCTNTIVFQNNDIPCTSTITNNSDQAVLATIISSVGNTPFQQNNFQQIMQSDLLILPGQEYFFTVTYPGAAYNITYQPLTVHAAFRAVATEGVTYETGTSQYLVYIPFYLLLLLIGILALLCGTLIKNLRHKFTVQTHANQSPSQRGNKGNP